MGGRLDWTIDRVEEKRNNQQYFHSKDFYSKINGYKMSMRIRINPDSRFEICLFIWDDVKNKFLNWPFKATVTMTIRGREGAEKSQRENIELAQPGNNSYKYHDFHFEYSDLLAANLVVNDCMTIECIVDE